jgi:hypothetical protein
VELPVRVPPPQPARHPPSPPARSRSLQSNLAGGDGAASDLGAAVRDQDSGFASLFLMGLYVLLAG